MRFEFSKKQKRLCFVLSATILLCIMHDNVNKVIMIIRLWKVYKLLNRSKNERSIDWNRWYDTIKSHMISDITKVKNNELNTFIVKHNILDIILGTQQAMTRTKVETIFFQKVIDKKRIVYLIMYLHPERLLLKKKYNHKFRSYRNMQFTWLYWYDEKTCILLNFRKIIFSRTINLWHSGVKLNTTMFKHNNYYCAILSLFLFIIVLCLTYILTYISHNIV